MIIKSLDISTYFEIGLIDLLRLLGGDSFHGVNRGLLDALSPENSMLRALATGRATGSPKGNCVTLRAFRLRSP